MSDLMTAAEIEQKGLAPMAARPGPKFWAALLLLAAVLAWGFAAWGWQILNGFKVTGLGVPVFWGLYVVNFVFFIAASMAGTLISAILRITDADWRRPFTRVAEAITIASLPFGAASILVDLGRPDRYFTILLAPHFTSPIIGDVVGITSYIAASCLYFYVALIPDLALCRDRAAPTFPGSRLFYRFAALGWNGTPRERAFHHRLMTVLSIVLLGLVVSVHTNLGFIFGLTTKPGWHGALMGPYFVVGAAFQGLGVLAAISVLLRRSFKMEWAITHKDLDALRKLFFAVCCLWAYFTIVEILTTYYGQQAAEMAVLRAKLTGQFSLPFWGMLAFAFFIPISLLTLKVSTLERRLLAAGISVNIGMWLERYSIIIPSSARPYLPWGYTYYSPSWVEWSVTAAWLAGFILLILIFSRAFPMLTIWELTEKTDLLDHFQ